MLCELYGKQRMAIFDGSSSNSNSGGGMPEVLFETRVGGDIRREVRGLFAEVLRALRRPPAHRRRIVEQRRRRGEARQLAAEEEERAAMVAGMAEPLTVAEALAQVAARPPAPLRRRVAGELGALMRRRAGHQGGGSVGGPNWLGPVSKGRQHRVVIIRHRWEEF